MDLKEFRGGLRGALLAPGDAGYDAARFRTCSATEHADLFWGLRGGGGNLGLVTSFLYRLHPIGPIVTGGVVLYPAERATEALRFYRECMATASEDEMVVFAFQAAPSAPFVPACLHATPIVAFALCHLGSPAEGQRAIDRIAAINGRYRHSLRSRTLVLQTATAQTLRPALRTLKPSSVRKEFVIQASSSGHCSRGGPR